ncbi:putative transmembrane protein [Toxoplasma gondii TgCatPRC2]|uniref:Putative transmembrane protein n=1 Tax=Toxoplasma gondii TgCatPRC2 TaxID=1130821 RepID=A0A151H9B7_TOXGO|nr:putative transmembrane protein [Toxoplasma gondii TgCatPRC2]
MTPKRPVSRACVAAAATPRWLCPLFSAFLCFSAAIGFAVEALGATQTETASHSEFTKNVAAVLSDPRGQVLTLDSDLSGLSELLFSYESTIARLSGDSASPVSPEEARTKITELLQKGRWRLPYPRIYRVIEVLTKDFVEARTGSGLPWWMAPPPYKKKPKDGPVSFGISKRGWETCSRKNLKGFAVGRTLPEVLDDLQIQMQALVETVLVGEFGVCGPFFLNQKRNQYFDCIDAKNQDVIFPLYFVSTTNARHVRVSPQDSFELNCAANCEAEVDAISRRRTWEAFFQGSLADDPESGRLGYSPLLPSETETSLSRLLFSSVPDWSQFKNGSADQTDAQAVLSVAQEFVDLLNAFYSEVFVSENLRGSQASDAAARPMPGAFHARSVLALFDELEMNFCSWAKAQGLMSGEGQKRRYQVASWLSGKDLRDTPVSFHLLAGIQIQVLDFLTMTSGTPWDPSAWWRRIEKDLAVNPLSDVAAYHSGMRRLAAVSRQFIQKFLAPLPVALRAALLALVGRWAAEWAKEASLPEDREFAAPPSAAETSEKYFDFSDRKGRAPKLFFLTTLTGGRSPAEAAARSISESFRMGDGANLSRIVASSSKSKKVKMSYLPIGRVVHVGACPSLGPGMWAAFADPTGLTSGSLSLSRTSLRRAFELIASSSSNALAPFAAAASVLEQIKVLGADLEGATEAELPLALLESRMVRTKFAQEYHCAVAKRELARYLRRSTARTKAELEALVQDTVVEIAYNEPLPAPRSASTRGDSSSLMPPDDGLLERPKLYISCSFARDAEERNAFVDFVMARRTTGRFWRGIRGVFRSVKRRVLRLFRRPIQRPAEASGDAQACVSVEQPPTSVIPASIRQAQRPAAWRMDALTHLHLPRSYGPYLFSLLQDLPAMDRPFDLRASGQLSENSVVLATDVDDTLIASGGWKIRHPPVYIGGADTMYSMKTGYPGMGPLYYLLTRRPGKQEEVLHGTPPASPTTSTTSGATDSSSASLIRAAGQDSPPAREQSRVLPLIMLTARLSMKFLRPIFRPRSLYTQMARLYDYGAAMMTKSLYVAENSLLMENPQPIVTAIRGKGRRGLNKVNGIEIYMRQAADGTADPSLPLTPATRFMFAGDTFERDLEACSVLGMRQQKSFLSCFMHIVFDATTAGGSRQGAFPPTFGSSDFRDAEELPRDVILFNLAKHGVSEAVDLSPKSTVNRQGEFSGALGAAVRYAVRLPPDALPSWGDASCEQVRLDYAWQLSQQVGVRLRHLLNTLRFSWKRDNMSNILELESSPPLIFLNCSHIERAEPGDGPSIRFLPPEESSPFSGPLLDQNGRVRVDGLGLPIVTYRTAVGAALHARFLNLIDQKDMANLAVATIRQQRNLGPPATEARAEQWTELMADLRLQQLIFGDVPPAAFLAAHSFSVNSSLSDSTGQRLRTVTCRTQQEETFELFAKVLRSTFEAGQAYQAALETAWSAWTRASRLYCVYEPEFLHLCTAGQAELEYLVHSVARVSPFIPAEPSSTTAEMCQMRGQGGEITKPAYEQVLLGVLSRLCLANLDACRNLLAHLQDMGRLAQWRVETPSATSTGPGLVLDSFGFVAYPDSNPRGGLRRKLRLPSILKAMVRQTPAEKQTTWAGQYDVPQWVETAAVWKQFEVCLITPLQRLATRTAEELGTRRWGFQAFKLDAAASELTYPNSPISSPDLLLRTIGAKGFKPSRGTESVEGGKAVDLPGPQRGIVTGYGQEFAERNASPKERAAQLLAVRDERARTIAEMQAVSASQA